MASDPHTRTTDVLPRLSVVVPAYRCGHQLRPCLQALQQSTVPRDQWELVVVDDGSPDDTGAIARLFADRVIRTGDAPRGPAYARNCGAQEARADLLLFVDADVVVRPDVLERVLAHFAETPDLTAVFGSYDAAPAAPGLVSQYRNLLHRYVHFEGAGPATTFWAGIGAVRRQPFAAAGGFDANRYPRPQIEDIDLGVRLHHAGGMLQLDTTITGTHLKQWTLGAMLRTDLRDRAVPWMRLLLERRTVLADGPLNTSRREQILVACTAAAMTIGTLGLVSANAKWGGAALALLAPIIVGNMPLFRWFAAQRGLRFAAYTIPLRVLFYAVSVIGAAIATVQWLLTPRFAPPAEWVPRAVPRNTESCAAAPHPATPSASNRAP